MSIITLGNIQNQKNQHILCRSVILLLMCVSGIIHNFTSDSNAWEKGEQECDSTKPHSGTLPGHKNNRIGTYNII